MLQASERYDPLTRSELDNLLHEAAKYKMSSNEFLEIKTRLSQAMPRVEPEEAEKITASFDVIFYGHIRHPDDIPRKEILDALCELLAIS